MKAPSCSYQFLHALEWPTNSADSPHHRMALTLDCQNPYSSKLFGERSWDAIAWGSGFGLSDGLAQGAVFAALQVIFNCQEASIAFKNQNACKCAINVFISLSTH